MPLLSLRTKELELSQFGIVDFGYVEDPIPLSIDRFKSSIKKISSSPLSYLKGDGIEARKSLKNVFPEFESALVFLFQYKGLPSKKIGRFIRGFDDRDYHDVVKEKLKKVEQELLNCYPGIKFMSICDTYPVLEKDLAYKAGLGWFGKNSLLINPKFGSYTIIGFTLLNQKLELDQKGRVENLCGECTLCIDSCPTGAIGADLVLDASKCISTFTIETFKECNPPRGYIETDWIFGCDSCQDCCPWNKKLPDISAKKDGTATHEYVDLVEKLDLDSLDEELSKMSNREFKRKFKGTSFERTGRKGLLKNIYSKAAARQS